MAETEETTKKTGVPKMDIEDDVLHPPLCAEF